MRTVVTVVTFLIVLALVSGLPAQGQLFISGTVTDEDRQPIAGALVGAGMFTGVADSSGRFAIGGAAGAVTLKVAAAGFETMTMELVVPPDGPLYGLEVRLRRAPRTEVSSTFAPEEAKTIVQAAAEEWGPWHPHVRVALEAQVRASWPDTLDEPIPLAETEAIDIHIAPPYVLYRSAIAEAIRKMESTAEVSYPAAVAVIVTPKQIGAPDIERVVVERNGQVMNPVRNALERTVMTSRMGVEVVVHSGVVEYDLAAFAPGGTVRVTAIPRTGSNFVAVMDDKRLSAIR